MPEPQHDRQVSQPRAKTQAILGRQQSPGMERAFWVSVVTAAPESTKLPISGSPSPCPTRWSKRVSPHQPQVDDLIGREIRVRGGHAGIPSEARKPSKADSFTMRSG
jgi:hypothetical protein